MDYQDRSRTELDTGDLTWIQLGIDLWHRRHREIQRSDIKVSMVNLPISGKISLGFRSQKQAVEFLLRHASC